MTGQSPASANAASEVAPEDDAALVERVSQARRSGAVDRTATEELLRRASAKNEAALDRLGR